MKINLIIQTKNFQLFPYIFYLNFSFCISNIVPMFDVSVEGIEEAMDYLRNRGENMFTKVQQFKGLNY